MSLIYRDLDYMPPSLPSRVLGAIKSVVGDIPTALHEPMFSGNEWPYLKECLDTTFVSSVGKFVDKFELDLAEFTGSKNAVAVVNGTSALHVILTLSGVGRGDEVLVPALSFIATANAITYCGATPHFVDSEEKSLGVDADKLRDYLNNISRVVNGECVNIESGRRIKALLIMHTFGHIGDMERLIAVAQDFKITLLEDAAEALGSHFNGFHAGTFGLMSALSFNGNKIITTGGGGAILTNDPVMAERAKHLTTTAKIKHSWEYIHDEVGYNYRMPNINAALGCAQLEKLPTILSKKRLLFDRYLDVFSSVSGVKLFKEPVGSNSNYWLQTLVLDSDQVCDRDQILLETNNQKISTRPIWKLLHKQPPYIGCQAMDLSCAEMLEKRIINIPSSPGIV